MVRGTNGLHQADLTCINLSTVIYCYDEQDLHRMLLQGAAARSEASSPQVATPGRVAKASDPQKTIKSMAASLFRAFDEGRLKERAPAPAADPGEPCLSFAYVNNQIVLDAHVCHFISVMGLQPGHDMT